MHVRSRSKYLSVNLLKKRAWKTSQITPPSHLAGLSVLCNYRHTFILKSSVDLGGGPKLSNQHP